MASPTKLAKQEAGKVPVFGKMKAAELKKFYADGPYEIEDFEGMGVKEMRGVLYEVYNEVEYGVEGVDKAYTPPKEEDEDEAPWEDEKAKEKTTTTKKKAAKKPAKKSAEKPAKKTTKKAAKGKKGLPAVDDTKKGEVLGPDIISETAHELESIPNAGKAQALLLELMEEGDFNYFKLGGVLSVIQTNNWFGEHASFRHWVQEEVKGLQYRKATRLTKIYRDIVESGVEWDDVKDIGWTLLKEIAPILTKKNVKKWVKKAKNSTSMQLHAEVQNYLVGETIEGDSEGSASTAVSTQTFKVHEDQKETITKAIEKAKEEGNTDVNTVALEYICLDYLGKGGEKKKKKEVPLKMQFLAIAKKNDDDLEVTATEILGLFEEAFPTIKVEASFVDDEDDEEDE